MLRMSVGAEECLMIGEDIKLVFLGGTGKHMKIMIDAPKEMNIVRSRKEQVGSEAGQQRH